MPTFSTEPNCEGQPRRRRVEATARDLRSIGRRCAALVGDGPSSVEHGDVLYDEYGLPK
ncbi:hypothetical protein [Candidatus Poriferisodalis sp.]|uniref:hypothetical protein n=1 Tax=Candidatus Poriferisodalis sp. TaxID=3101277 RepID=UPI003AF80F1F